MIGNTYLVKGRTRELKATLVSIREDISKGVFLVEGQKIELPLEIIEEWFLLTEGEGKDTN